MAGDTITGTRPELGPGPETASATEGKTEGKPGRRRGAAFRSVGLSAGLCLFCLWINAGVLHAQTSSPATASTGAQASPSRAVSAETAAHARVRRRAARRRRLLAQQQEAAERQEGSATTVGLTAEQRARDAQILAAQKKQSDAIASENDALTKRYIEDQQRVQAEPRIQDAPGPDSTPLPGEPAVMPAQDSEPPRIQDAPGPAQTLPKAPPPEEQAPAAPAPAPEQ